MKLGNILLVSIKNIIHKKSAYIKVLLGFFFIFFINFTIIFYSGSLSSVYVSYENSSASNAIIRVLYTLSNSQISEIRTYNQIKSICFGKYENYGGNESVVEITIGETEYRTNTEDYETINVFYVNRESDTVLTENYEIEFKEKTQSEPIKYGRNLQDANEILVSETILEILEISADFALGKTINIKCGDIYINATICGILDKRMRSMQLSYFDFICYQSTDSTNNYFNISVKGFKDNELLVEKIKLMVPEGDGVCFWMGDYIAGQMILVEAQEELCSKFLSLMSVIVFVVMCVYVGCNQYFLMQKNAIFYGILQVNGVSNRNVFIIHFLELFLLCMFSLALSVLASIGIFFALKYMMSNVYSINILFPYFALVWSVPTFLCVGAILSYLLSLYIYLRILNRPPIHLLRMEQ